jgi:hypothetical protein
MRPVKESDYHQLLFAPSVVNKLFQRVFDSIFRRLAFAPQLRAAPKLEPGIVYKITALIQIITLGVPGCVLQEAQNSFPMSWRR